MGIDIEQPPKRKLITIAPRTSLVKVKFTKNTDLTKNQHNVRTVLSCSDATPIGRYGGIGYGCCFCDQGFPQPDLLKRHTLETHSTAADISSYGSTRNHGNFVVKLDITDLKCTLCNTPKNNLEDLTTHLTNFHQKRYYKDVKSCIIPFQFGANLFYCAICSTEYTNFKILLVHMNDHFRNYICETCGQGFVNNDKLQSHMYRHNKGEYKCSHCEKVFDNNVKCKDHERAIHKMNRMRSKCGYCGERFNDYAKKNEHMNKKHGVKLIELKCKACPKTFDNRRSLTLHTKSYHPIERKPKK